MGLFSSNELSTLGFSDKWLLLIEALSFIVVAGFILAMTFKARKQTELDLLSYSRHHNNEHHNRSAYNMLIRSTNKSHPTNQGFSREGLFFKSIFFDFLCITCLLRAVGALVILGTTYDSDLYWLYLILTKLPSLLFFSAFSFFIYFFARIVMEEESDTNNLLKPFFFTFNAMTYIFFFGIAIYNNGYIYYSNAQFLKALCGLFGVVYLIFAICMTNYGTRLALILSNLLENSEREEKEMLKALNLRVIFITVFMSLIFTFRAVYNLLFTWGLVPRYFPETMNPIFWDSLFQIIYELIPCVFILLIIIYQSENLQRLKMNGLFRDSLGGTTAVEDNQSFDSEENYGNFNPNLNAQLLTAIDRVK